MVILADHAIMTSCPLPSVSLVSSSPFPTLSLGEEGKKELFDAQQNLKAK